MYVTRPLSMFRKFPSSLSKEPDEEDGPNTGILVITDEEAEAEDTFCCGFCKLKTVERLPFPQDKIVKVFDSSEFEHSSYGGSGTKVWFIPVIDQPLSANLYYVVKAKGRHKGKACTGSREMDMGMCCFNQVINDVKPKPLDYRNIYQQFKIHRHHNHTFYSKSLSSNAIPPKFLRQKGWQVHISARLPHTKYLPEALGLDTSLRTQLPSFNFPIMTRRSPSVIVGKWYCPVVFVKENPNKIRYLMRKSSLYKMTLEQRWEEIGFGENGDVNEVRSVVNVSVSVRREKNTLSGVEAMKEKKVSDGFVWFRVGGRRCVGLSVAIMEKMKWVQEEGGWVGGREREVRVERVVEIGGDEGWCRFGCYVLVESFVLRRLDGSLVLRSDFRHTHRVRCKWE